jgi:large subunit ribosomal protein L22
VTGVKTNEMPGTRAVLRHYRMSATKARQVLDLVRGQEVDRAEEILRSTPREGARVVAKVLASAVANARNNDLLDPDDLYVSACFADEGTTMKRWRPRARGRATRIRKRTCHITVIVSRLPEDRLEVRRARQATATAGRARRVAASRRSEEATTKTTEAVDVDEDAAEDVGTAEDVEGEEATDTVEDVEVDEDADAEEEGAEEEGAVAEAEDEVENVDADATDAEEKD